MTGAPSVTDHDSEQGGRLPLAKEQARLKWGQDPTQFGSMCSRCSLYGHTVVPSEVRPNAELTIVAEAPGQHEETLGYPMCGPSGAELEAALTEAGITRSHVSILNVMCCRPPGNNYEAHLRLVATMNKQRAKAGKPLLLKPHEACLPRLIHELKGAKGLVLVGKYARQAIIGVDADEKKRARDRMDDLEVSLDDDEVTVHSEERIPGRGFPGHAAIHGARIPCLTSVHPAYVLRSRRWTIPFRSDIKKAVRMARGQLKWTTPEMLFFPTPDELEHFLDTLPPDELVAYDVETDGLRPTEVNLRCIGIGTKSKVTCVPFRTVQSIPAWSYSREDKQRIREILLRFFANKQGVIVAHNGKYDHAVLEHCGELPGLEMGRREFDTAIAHHVVWSEWPHDLDFLIAQYTDAPHHKGKNHDRWESDRELHYYCMLDVSRTSECASFLIADPRLAAQKRAFKTDMFLSFFCRKLGDVGMKIDIKERDRLFVLQTSIMEQKQADARRMATEALERTGKASPGSLKLAESFNPGSTLQVGKLLYDALEVEPAPEKSGGYTDTGALSTKSDVLYFLMDRGLSDLVENFLLAIIDYRGAQKLRGTYCTVVPCRDGRVRSSWNPHVVVSGRLSGSDPNLLNLERSIRSMYIPEPGNLLVACDKAQQEIRVVAWLAQDTRWISAIMAGADIHRVNAVDLLDIPTVDQVSKGHRQFTKTFVLAIQYLAGLKKAYQMVRNFVDPVTGLRPYRKISLSKISLCFKKFWDAHRAILDLHARNRAIYAQQGFLADEIHGRRRYFLDAGGDEEAKEEMANFLVQCSSASDMNDRIQEVMHEFPVGYAGKGTGVVHYCYDALVLEAPAHRALDDGIRLTQIMYSKLGDMPLPVDLAIGADYGHKTEYVKRGDMWVPKE